MAESVVGVANMMATKYTNEDVTVELTDQAIAWLSRYGGNFQFLLDMKQRGLNMSTAQVRAVLNCQIAEQAFNDKLASPEHVVALDNVLPIKVVAPIEPIVQDGTYTIDFKDDYITLRLRTNDKVASPFYGKQIASFLSGPDNTSDYTGFAFVTGKTFKVWSRFTSNSYVRQQTALLVLLNHDDPSVYGLAYAMQSGNCCKCGRKLTVPVSLHRGMGPICAEQYS